MTREQIIEKLRALEPELRAKGIVSLQMFGSRARGDDVADSDLDLLFEIEPGARFTAFDWAGTSIRLSERIGVPTSLFSERGLKPRMRERIANDLIPIFNA